MGRRGDAVVETREGVVFAALGVPGDRVRLEQVSRKGKVRRGRIAAVLEASPRGRKFFAACTPGYYSNEGVVDTETKSLAATFPGGKLTCGVDTAFAGIEA